MSMKPYACIYEEHLPVRPAKPRIGSMNWKSDNQVVSCFGSLRGGNCPEKNIISPDLFIRVPSKPASGQCPGFPLSTHNLKDMSERK